MNKTLKWVGGLISLVWMIFTMSWTDIERNANFIDENWDLHQDVSKGLKASKFGTEAEQINAIQILADTRKRLRNGTWRLAKAVMIPFGPLIIFLLGLVIMKRRKFAIAAS